MLGSRTHRSRGGVVAIGLVGAGVITLGAVGVISFLSPTSPGTGSGTSTSTALSKPKVTPPVELGAVLILAGITPEGLAAAGATSSQTTTIFDTCNAYCLQAERLDQLRLAHRALNQAKDRAVHKPLPQITPPRPSVAQAASAVTDQENDAFNFVTSSLDSGTKAKLATIRANSSWHLPAYYLTVQRTDEQWLALRGAVAAKQHADKIGQAPAQAPAAVLADADANATVTQAKSDFNIHLAEIRQTWSTRALPPP